MILAQADVVQKESETESEDRLVTRYQNRTGQATCVATS